MVRHEGKIKRWYRVFAVFKYKGIVLYGVLKKYNIADTDRNR